MLHWVVVYVLGVRPADDSGHGSYTTVITRLWTLSSLRSCCAVVVVVALVQVCSVYAGTTRLWTVQVNRPREKKRRTEDLPAAPNVDAAPRRTPRSMQMTMTHFFRPQHQDQ